jgi:tetratricopeptide (TPR) repeat protein
MSSIIPGYTYDIFISYRQKDNKGDRWVSEFVEALKTELESTFKEEISVYFDINPSDGLLETHDVDASLKEKLKCLVFIPVISRTYCDPKSFAWEHEFKAFVEQSSVDQFGLKVNLLNGNVTSRILPIRIHDLDITDIKLCESVLGGVLRGIDFVYKTSGVNRPLRAIEDHPYDNINKTYYRDQINKVANSIKDIITVLKKHYQKDEAFSKEEIITELIEPEKSKNRKTKVIIASLIALVILTLTYFFLPEHRRSSGTLEKTIAVLPFEKWFSDKDYSYLGDAVASQINSQLRAVKTLYVISFNSTRHYIVSDMPSFKQIGKECGANILVQGSVELSDNNKDITINVQLINTKNNNPIWDDKFKGELDSLQTIRSKIIIKIAQELKVDLSPEEVKKIGTGLTKSSDAYKNFLSGNYQDEAASLAMMGKKYQDSTSYELAIKMYDKAIMYDSSFALAYARRAISRSWAYVTGSLTDPGNIEKCKQDIDKALKINPKLPEAQNAYGFYYCYCKKNFGKALEYFQLASDLDPGNWQPIFYLATVYRSMGEWNKSQALLTKVLKYNPQDALVLTNIAASYCYLRDYDSALIYNDMAIKILPNWTAPYINKISVLCLKEGSTKEARHVIDTAIKNTNSKFQKMKILLDIYDLKFEEALINTELADPSVFIDQGDKLLLYAMIHNYLNHHDLSKIYYDSALVFFKKKLKEHPESATNYIQIGNAYAGLKDNFRAIEAGKKAVELSTSTVKKDDMLTGLAEIYIKCGDYKNGFRQINDLLKSPSYLSVKLLMLDPVWKPILDKPEFKELLSDYSLN